MEFRYKRQVNYYETDKMGVVHHSNYARYLEECRIEMLKQYGMPYDMLEEMGYMIPVLDLKCTFKEPARFGETLIIVPKLEQVTAARFYVSYIIYDETMTNVKHLAETSHCFLDKDFNLVSMKKREPELYEKLLEAQGGQYA
ncbi:MAG: acyl-CoA thioesterase [Clostridium sp.]|nr:acyl-CoA thioesterase [Clostridium sp.]MCM1400119.1 acyl-CoA thioesterase [Clostridium sp.]MCM1460806.1 acyl-CoA thioesterase [Bacteroides sp.]